jgi:D-alanyl-lipoteichoic acid acyltransferase DltB (MBOAT superfamily)
MLFTTPEFLVFFLVATVGHFSLRPRHRWAWLLASSIIFYAAWSPAYPILLLVSTLIVYVLAILIARTSTPAGRKAFLILGLVLELGMLGALKYWGFVSDSLNAFFGWSGLFIRAPEWQPLFPVGISFITFQTSGYLIDVYRGKVEPERHVGMLILFVSFFPQLVAGPIERARRLLPQFRARHNPSVLGISSGLRLMAWGMFKKVVVADRLAVYVDAVYDNPTLHRGWPVILASYFFAVQIYCDFSGYTDMALGTARVLGYRLTRNFAQPYCATSIGAFWRRWHISLTSWFRDYLYIPLGGNRVPKWRWYANLMTVFLLSGLWHGPSWTFVLWGGLHGLYRLVEIWTRGIQQTVVRRLNPGHTIPWTAIRTLVTLNLVCFAWLFFRANSLADAGILIANMLQIGTSTDLHQPWTVNLGNPSTETVIGLGLVALVAIEQVLREYPLPVIAEIGQNRWVRGIAFLLLVLAILNLGLPRETPFVYLQF